MATITTRAGKGSPLTNDEVDANFTNLNTDKAETDGATLTNVDINSGTIDGVTIGGASAGAGTFTTITGSGDMAIDTDTLFVDVSADRVGINTASPTAPLHVNHGGGLGVLVDSGGEAISMGTFGSGTAERPFLRLTDGAGGYNALLGGTNSTGTTDTYFAATAGKVGIGTNSPLTLLDVRGAATFNEGGADVDFRVESDTNTHALFVDGSSNSVGINNSSPATALDVTGTISGNTDVILTGGGSPRFESVDTTDNITTRLFSGNTVGAAGTYSNHPFSLVSNSTTKIKILANGGVEFTPEAGGHIVINEDSVDADFRVESDTNTHALFVDAGNSRVGINNSSPTSALDVTGTVTADGLTVDGIFRVDALSPAVNLVETDVTDLNTRIRNTVGEFRLETINDALSSVTRRLQVDHATGDTSFYEPTGTTPKFFWDSSQEQLNLTGNFSGVAPFSTYSNGYTAEYNSYSAEAGFQIMSYQSDAGSPFTKTSDLIANGDGTVPAEMRFLTKANGASNPTERMRIDSSGTLTHQNAAVFNESGGDNDFRVESDASTHALFVQGSDGFVGVGNSSPVAKFQVGTQNTVAAITIPDCTIGNQAVIATASGSPALSLGYYSVGYGMDFWVDTAFPWNCFIDVRNATSNVVFRRNTGASATETMRITSAGTLQHQNGAIFNESGADADFRVESDTNTHALFVEGSSGNVGINKSAPTRTLDIEGASNPLAVKLTAGSNPVIRSEHYSTADANWYHIRFFTGGGAGGAILVNGSTGTVTYSTTSDYRLKENVVDMTGAINRVKALNPIRFNWTKAPEGRVVDGFIAHEVSEIVPEAVSGGKDAVDENGNIDPQGIDQAKLVPLLTGAIQEAIAKIETLEARIAMLENA